MPPPEEREGYVPSTELPLDMRPVVKIVTPMCRRGVQCVAFTNLIGFATRNFEVCADCLRVSRRGGMMYS